MMQRRELVQAVSGTRYNDSAWVIWFTLQSREKQEQVLLAYAEAGNIKKARECLEYMSNVPIVGTTASGALVIVDYFDGDIAAAQYEAGMLVLSCVGGKLVGTIVKKVEGFVDPKTLRFTQNSLDDEFKEGKGALLDTIEGLKNGSIKPEDFPPIRIFTTPDGKIWSLDNRRLYVFQEAGISIPYRWATAKEVAKEIGRKMTTVTDGLSIRVRGGANK